jgi:flavin-dependent dehydrogenase
LIIAHHHFHASVQRHDERLTTFPEGFLVIGDALCTFSRTYAEGMSAAARQARLLRDVRAPCNPAAGFAFAFPQTRGASSAGMQERARNFAALDRLQVDDRELQPLRSRVFARM